MLIVPFIELDTDTCIVGTRKHRQLFIKNTDTLLIRVGGGWMELDLYLR